MIVDTAQLMPRLIVDPLLSVKSVKTSKISRSALLASICEAPKEISEDTAPLDGSSAILEGVGTLANHGVKFADISSFNMKSINEGWKFVINTKSR